MKSILSKILIITSLVLSVPFFSHASPSPSLTCSPAYPSDLTGKTVTFTAHVRNGTGSNYDYLWTGNNGEDGSSSALNYVYGSDGQYTVQVTASSTDSSDYLTASCSVQVYALANLPDFTASCTPNTDSAVFGQNITWNSNISGPLAPYSIVWIGTDGLNSNATNPVISYSSSGDKTATMVSFQSRYGAQTAVHNAKLSNIACTSPVNVVGEDIHNPSALSVTGSCSPSSTNQNVNATTSWNSIVNILGGSAPYRVIWKDNNGVIGYQDFNVSGTTTYSVSKFYSVAGTQYGSLYIQDNAGQEVDLQCGSVSVNVIQNNAGSTSGNGGGSRHIYDSNATSTATSTSATSTISTSTVTTNATPTPNTGSNTATTTATSTPNTGSNTSTATKPVVKEEITEQKGKGFVVGSVETSSLGALTATTSSSTVSVLASKVAGSISKAVSKTVSSVGSAASVLISGATDYIGYVIMALIILILAIWLMILLIGKKKKNDDQNQK